MNKSNVVWMGAVRDLLSELDRLRSEVLAGNVQGWGGTVKFSDGREVVYLGGTYKESSEDRVRAMLKVSATRMKLEDPPLPLRKTRI
jgi:hypothetical protein